MQRATFWASTLVLSLASIVNAQVAISARSGLVHYAEGDVLLEGNPVDPQPGHFPEIGVGQTLTAEQGRAEVLLTPGVFLRLAENSSIRMLSNLLWDVKVELLSGDISIEAGAVPKEQSLRLQVGESIVEIRKTGLYRLSAETGTLRVYQGEADVLVPGRKLVVKGGRETDLRTALTATKFDAETGDPFQRWAAHRAEKISMANVAAARSYSMAGFSSSTGYSSGYNYGTWGWNPVFGSFTYIPFGAAYFSPFGYRFHTPHTVTQLYDRPRLSPAPTFGGGYGYGGWDAGYSHAPAHIYTGGWSRHGGSISGGGASTSSGAGHGGHHRGGGGISGGGHSAPSGAGGRGR